MYNDELYHYGKKGMKWGVRRYQNKDGSLTPAGKQRYARDIRENNAKKKDNRINIDGPDVKRWAREDLERSKKVVDSSSSMVKELKNIEKNTRPSSKNKPMDLSNMTDQQLRDKINRANLERQYTEIYGQPEKVSRGRERVNAILDTAGSVLAVTGSAIGIAVSIKYLMDG